MVQFCRPRVLTFCHESKYSLILLHFQIYESQEVIYDGLHINATSTSTNFIANTDGWDTYRSDRVIIQNSVINNGDDCVSFKPSTFLTFDLWIRHDVSVRFHKHPGC